VPKLLAIDRKLRTLSRRLVTDAGGAPCCCSPQDGCPCDPSLPLWTQRYRTCVNGRKVTRRPLPLGRIVRVRFSWQYTTETLTGVRRPSQNVNDQVARQYIYNGSGVVCWRLNQQPVIASGLSYWFYRQSGTNIETIEEERSDRGELAFVYRGGTLAAIPAVRPPANTAEPNYDMQLPFATLYGGPVSPNWSPDLCEWAEDITTTVGEGGPFGQLVQRNIYTYAFSDNGTLGAVVGTTTFDSRDTRSYLGTGGEAVQREVASWSLAWERTVLTCESGGVDQLLRPETGCSNCGDRSTLEPFA
jgi:hypothetical protein